MSEKEFPSCAYDVCAEFDCEETMALALIATRNELDRTKKKLDEAIDLLEMLYGDYNLDWAVVDSDKVYCFLEQINQKEDQ